MQALNSGGWIWTMISWGRELWGTPKSSRCLSMVHFPVCWFDHTPRFLLAKSLCLLAVRFIGDNSSGSWRFNPVHWRVATQQTRENNHVHACSSMFIHVPSLLAMISVCLKIWYRRIKWLIIILPCEQCHPCGYTVYPLSSPYHIPILYNPLWHYKAVIPISSQY